MTAGRFTRSVILGPLALGATAMASTTAEEGPLALKVVNDGVSVTLTVTGAAPAPVEVSYDLQVEGASSVHQRGRAALRPGGGEQLVRVSINADRPWRATLRITEGAREFVQHVGS